MSHTQLVTAAVVLSLCAVAGAKTPAAARTRANEYDPLHETVLTGTVQRVVRHNEQGRIEIHLIVALRDLPVEVHLGPPHFLAWHQFHVEVGARVEIVAARAKEEPHYIARRIQVGRRMLTLRDERGLPLWR